MGIYWPLEILYLEWYILKTRAEEKTDLARKQREHAKVSQSIVQLVSQASFELSFL